MKKYLLNVLSKFLYRLGYVKLTLADVDIIDEALEDHSNEALEEEGIKGSIIEYSGDTGWLKNVCITSKTINGLRERLLFED